MLLLLGTNAILGQFASTVARGVESETVTFALNVGAFAGVFWSRVDVDTATVDPGTSIEIGISASNATATVTLDLTNLGLERRASISILQLGRPRLPYL